MPSQPNIDIDSATWVGLREWAEKRLVDCRQRNDAAIGVEETATLRGQIRTLKELLALESAVREAQRLRTPGFAGISPHDD